ncbi:MAG: hypothetical protein GKR89_17245 [Candidatus Latescibacteria bacterium]|nr:hypothetical protein [Candidatus Latescibacterota bacterium]
MTFKGHAIGGALAGVGLVGLGVHWGYIGWGEYRLWAQVWGTTLFFSLFPDLDTASVPQRWFFRLVFAVLVYLGWNEYYELATLVGLLSLLPLLDHHRGWTHWKISPLLVSLLLGIVYEYWRVRTVWFGTFSWENVEQLIQGHLIFLAACIIGWYTHLLLDGRFKFFPTNRDHH